ncbi:MAG: glutamine--tRNA ligase/YqeY domain fusion protein [Bordetella sp.]|nr:MAG: glutamine--tRNA ligase/YqeY domain fusion protein [Bordetella sp.]
MNSNSKLSHSSSNFICRIIEDDIKSKRFEGKLWVGKPGPSSIQAFGKPDQAQIRTRFPPEPNGYLHIGHVKSICLNFGLAKKYGGICHLRFDDTNPNTEKKKYVDSIIEAIQWLGFDWRTEDGQENLYFASDYFCYMYEFAEAFIEAGYAYIDEQTPLEIRMNRGSLTELGINSPWRNRPISESLYLFREMYKGKYPEESLVLRAKVNMKSPNINLRDPIIYRIRNAEHHRIENQKCYIYPMYSWAHPIEDALEGITHSICTLEFQDQRPFYNWVLNKLSELGKISHPLPTQYEFSRLNMTHVVTSKRKLSRLVKHGYVDGWDDPRMPTLLGLRRRGYTASSLRLFCESIGISKSDTYIDFNLLEQSIRNDLDPIVKRSVAILNPLKLIITNFPKDRIELCTALKNPHTQESGKREFPFSRELWIERDDFLEDPPKNYFRLFPGNIVRLKYSYIIRCTGFHKDSNGRITEVYAEYLKNTKSGTLGSNSVKVKGNITWVSLNHAIPAYICLYDRLFSDPYPDIGDKDFINCLNPDSKKTISAWLEPGTFDSFDKTWQFERLGYFVLDSIGSYKNLPILNRIVSLKNSWS